MPYHILAQKAGSVRLWRKRKTMQKMHKKTRHREETLSTKTQVLKEYWKAIHPHVWSAVFVASALVITGLVSIFTPVFYKQFFDVLTASSDNKVQATPVLVKTIFYIFALNAVSWAAFRSASFVNAGFQTKVMAGLKRISFEYLLGHSYSFFASRFTGSLVQRVNRFARSFEVLADRLLWSIIPLGVRITGMSIVVWFIEPVITFSIIALVFAFMIFNYFFTRWKLKYEIERAEADSFSTAVLSDAITNHNTVQLFNGEKAETDYFREVTGEQARITRFTWNLHGITDSVQAGFLIVAELALFYFSIKYWQAGIFTVGTFVLIQAYIISLGGQLWDFSRIIRDLYQSFADAKEMVDVLVLPQEIKDSPEASPLKIFKGNMYFEDAAFTFKKGREVLKSFNLEIRGGEKTALVGPSGSGKSTIVRLIMRLYDVSGGKIKIDGQDIKSVTLESLRGNIALVPQDPILFHRTLLENIRYGRRDATDEEVKRAGDLAHCDEFIKGLPYGYETYVGERGIKLSGGERQRIAIARAILKNAPILILDEATSSLDSHSEYLIQDALDKLMEGKTSIVIAHRLSTIRKMDRILVLDNGTVVEDGKHDELSTREGGLYNKLWNLQAGGFLADDEVVEEKVSDEEE